MIPEDQNRLPRPLGVTVLGVVLLLVGGAILANCARVAVLMPADIPKNILIFMVAGILPGLWAGATGVGLLQGAAWARSSFFTLAAISFVMVAGALSRGFKTQVEYARAGAVVAVFICMAWGIWYLLGEKGKAWFR